MRPRSAWRATRAQLRKPGVRKLLVFLCCFVWLISWSFVPFEVDAGGGGDGGDERPPGAEYLPGRTVGVAGFVALLWVTEVLPMPAAALFPVVLFPLLGVLSADVAAKAYYSDTIMVFVGSFLLSTAMERWNLHERMALRLLLSVGARPRLLLGGFMLATGLLSMWMSNTATTSMMVPLAMTTLMQLSKNKNTADELEIDGTSDFSQSLDESAGSSRESNSSEGESSGGSDPDQQIQHHSLLIGAEHSSSGEELVTGQRRRGKRKNWDPETIAISESDSSPPDLTRGEQDCSTGVVKDPAASMDPWVLRYCKGVLLSVAYSANVGGTSTLIGTGPNLALQQQLRTNFEGFEIGFAQWFAFAFPLALLFLLTVWVGFCFAYVPHPDRVPIRVNLFRERYDRLGPVSFPEGVVLATLVIMAILWFSRSGFGHDAPGWGKLFGEGSANVPRDGTVAIACSLLFFVIPIRPSLSERRMVLSWEDTRDLPWGIILLLGGGFCIAKACLESGLAAWIGVQIAGLEGLSLFWLVVVLCTVLIFTTELTSNVATANIILPVLAAIAGGLGENPLLLMVPATISCSFAFALPAATPPNALAFASGLLHVPDMAKPGMVLNLFGIVIIPLWMFSAGLAVFDIEIGASPTWADRNSTG